MNYRVYFIDENEHVRSARDIKAKSSQEAVDTARQFRGRQAVEIWQIDPAIAASDQMLRRFEPNGR
jgi:hypothetical protein